MTPEPSTPDYPASTPPSTPGQATFGMKRAAQVAGVSVSTLRRNKDLLREHGAVISPDGWQVPMSALIGSGLMRRTTPPDAPAPASQDAQADADAPDDDVHERVRALENEALELRHRAELAEERQRSAEQRARDARELADALAESLAVERRMITAGPSASPTAPKPAPETAAPQSPAPEPSTPRPGLLRRLFG